MVWLRCHALYSVVNQHVPAPLLRGWYVRVVTRLILWSNRNVPAPYLRGWSGRVVTRLILWSNRNVPAPYLRGWYGLRCQAIILWSIRMFRAFPSRMVWYALQPIKWDGRSRILTSSHFSECGDNRVRHVVLLMDGEVKVRPRRQGLMSPTPAETCLLQPSFKKNLYNHTDNRDSRPL